MLYSTKTIEALKKLFEIFACDCPECNGKMYRTTIDRDGVEIENVWRCRKCGKEFI